MKVYILHGYRLAQFLPKLNLIQSDGAQGTTVRGQDKEGCFLFTATTPRKSLLGAASYGFAGLFCGGLCVLK